MKDYIYAAMVPSRYNQLVSRLSSPLIKEISWELFVCSAEQDLGPVMVTVNHSCVETSKYGFKSRQVHHTGGKARLQPIPL